MHTPVTYIMRDQNKNSIDNIMQYDLTWRQKKSDKSLHLSIIAGLSLLAIMSQFI